VSVTYCLDRIYRGGEALCMHNAATGRELTMPHEIELAAVRTKVVVVGAGPGGVEAARIAAERGHETVVFEAASEAGGQLRLAAHSQRRREMISTIDWRMAQCAKHDVRFQFNTWAEAEGVFAENPDVVVIATGGLPDAGALDADNDFTVTTWDIISGDVKPAANVLIYDDAGDHPALQAAEVTAASGASVEIMTPHRMIAPEVMGINLVPYMRSLQDKDVLMTVGRRLKSVEPKDNQLYATIGTDYSDYHSVAAYDQIVVNHGILPLDGLYFDLKPFSSNLGEMDYDAFINVKPQAVIRNASGAFQLFRIGDAVLSRDTHASIYDALRLLKDI
jgi:NADPH-dependent 2,4-dienoyl-CoA reductase/sulfur reductase-like enzyme